MYETLKNQVERVLQKYPETRNSDITLTIQIWKEFYPTRVMDGKVSLADLYDLPREDNVKRVRAKFQNEENKYLPTVWEIARKRKINEMVWKNFIQSFPQERQEAEIDKNFRILGGIKYRIINKL